MEAEDDSASDGNLVSFRSEIHPLIFDSLGDSLVSFDFSSRPSVRIPSWRSLGTSQFILNVISQGYKIRFFELPTPFSKMNNASALSNRSFVSKAVNELLHANLVEEIFCVPDIVNPLSVTTRSSRKQRLILDLRHVSIFIFKQKFKCEDLSVAIQIFDQGCHLFKFDPESVTVTSRFSPRIESSLPSPGILEPVLQDIFSFASFRLGCPRHLSYLPKCSSRFLIFGEVGAFPSQFSLMTALVGGLILFPPRLIV